MRYIHFWGDAGICGTDYHYFMEFPDDTSDEAIDDISEDFRYDNAESFEYLALGWGNDFQDENERDDYYDNADGSWEELTKEDYDKIKEDYK